MAASVQVPGNITISLDTLQSSYCIGAPIAYTISFQGLSLKDNSSYNLGVTHLGVELRGSGPNGGPRGYIVAANPSDVILTNLSPVYGKFTLLPENEGYVYFFRANLYFDGQVRVLAFLLLPIHINITCI
jgi:hypothetical protein